MGFTKVGTCGWGCGGKQQPGLGDRSCIGNASERMDAVRGGAWLELELQGPTRGAVVLVWKGS